ncbi:MAG: TonB-dependent receptor plug domain-containing protein, partial [Bacteroidetes bacterium]|nr:TonB-dependent receptor plug domain-containing protein [Bacteroidota bacterium]
MHEDLLDGSQMSTIDLKTSDVNKMQGFLGEVEVIKSLQSIPGIKSFGDGSVFFHVRGGNKDQNLILIDDAPIYNPSHLLGFFSSFTPDAIKDVKIYKADIPLSQGGALSSLIDIRTKDGNMQKYGVYGNIGLIANKLSVEGPFVKDKSSFFFSVRRSHIDFLFGLITEEESNISFYDVNAKVNTKINEKNRIFLSFYSGLDQFGIPGISWSNGALTFRWNHLFNDRLFSNTIINTSRYDYFLYLNSQKTEFWQETITNGSFKTNFGFYKDPKNTIRFGLNISQHYFNPGNLTRSGAADEPAKILQSNARHLVTYISNEKKLNKKVTVRYGLRTNLWSNVGPSTYFLIGSEYEVTDTIIADRYEVFNRYNNPEPRISLRWSIDSVSSVKTSYGRTVQYLQLLSNSVSPFTSLEVWLPSGPNIKPQKADQVALGYYRKFMKAKSEFSAEVYYKLMYNQIDYEDHANLLLNPAIEGELRFGTGTAYGLELMMQRRQGRLTGWIAYTLSRAILEIEGINNDQPYPAFYDRPHDLTVYLDFELAERWELFANWIYTTGSAITTPTAFYTFQGTQVPIYDSKHNDRMPDYHRLDFSARWQLNRKKDNNFRHTLTFSIYNVYGRANPISINFNKKEIIFEEFIIPSNVLEGPKYVPTQRSLLGVIPSISYQFEF